MGHRHWAEGPSWAVLPGGSDCSQPGAETGQLGILPAPSLPYPLLWGRDPKARWTQGPVHCRLAPGVSSQRPGPPRSPHYLSPVLEGRYLICIAVLSRLSSIFNDRPRGAIGGKSCRGPF